MARFVDLSSEDRVEAYRDLGLEALNKARATHGRDSALFLNLAIQWIRFADAVALRTRGEEIDFFRRCSKAAQDYRSDYPAHPNL